MFFLTKKGFFFQKGVRGLKKNTLVFFFLRKPKGSQLKNTLADAFKKTLSCFADQESVRVFLSN